MAEKLKNIPLKLKEFWNKYTSKQKTIIISVVAVVFFAVVLLSYILTRTQYEQLVVSETTAEASEIVDLLKEEEIKYKLSSDQKIISVDKTRKGDAALLLGANDIPKLGMTSSEVFNNSMSTTNEERQLKAKFLLEDRLRTDMMAFVGVKDAVVRIDRPKEDYTILSETKEASVSILLSTTDEFEGNTVNAMANYVAGAVGNDSTDKVKITNHEGDLLFGGNNDLDSAGNINSNLEYKEKLRNQIVNRLTPILLKMGYDDAEIAPSNIQFDMNKVTELATKYAPADGFETGMMDTHYTYEGNNSSISGGVPGTDSNGDDTTYMLENNGNADSTTNILKDTYENNVTETNTIKEIGAIKKEDSSLGIVLTNYHMVREADLKEQGLLANMTFEEYIASNSTRTLSATPVPQEVYDTVANATGISANKITITAYDQNDFRAMPESTRNLSDYLMIVLAVLIIALLIFVVFKGTAPVEVTELEPELSVEQLLATTKENQSLDDIEFSEKSETRKLIEKFVDENPEAVAQLLRNWLNEDWG